MIKEINILEGRAREWAVKEDNKLAIELAQNLTDTLLSIPNRFYLCANEIGYQERALAIKFEDDVRIFFNPIFQSRKELKFSRELCLADNKEYIVPRFNEVSICYQDSLGKVLAVKLVNESALVAGQGMDAIDGLNQSYYGMEVLDSYDSLSDDEKADLLHWFFEERNSEVLDKLDDELLQDEKTKDEWTYYKLMFGMSAGDFEVTPKEPKINRKQRRLLDKLIKKLKRRGNK